MKHLGYLEETFNLMNPDQIKEYRVRSLQNQLHYCFYNSEFYQKLFKKAGFLPQDIKSIEDFRKLPILMDKDIERESQKESMERLGHPFGMHLCCQPQDVVFTGTTTGTTGIPTFTYTLSRDDLEKVEDTICYMLAYAGVHPGERVLFAHALGIYATTCTLWGIRKRGALPVDIDVRAGAKAILNQAMLTKPHAAFMTPSLAEYLIKKAPEIAGISIQDLKLNALFCVGEIGIGVPEIKQKIENGFGCRVYDWIGPIGGTIAFSCDSDEYYGMHCITPHTDLYPDDLVDPDTKQPIEISNGVIGEAVYSSLNRSACPMLRYASGDLVQVFTEVCPSCGFKGRRIKVVGRSDDMLIVKGTNVYPAAIKTTIARFMPDITGEMRIVLSEPPPRVTPPLVLKLEYGHAAKEQGLSELEEKIKEALHVDLRVTPKIIWCKPGELEKSLAKTPMFEKQF